VWAQQPAGTLGESAVEPQSPRVSSAETTLHDGAGQTSAAVYQAPQDEPRRCGLWISAVTHGLRSTKTLGGDTCNLVPTSPSTIGAASGSRVTSAISMRRPRKDRSRNRGKAPPVRGLHAARALEGLAAQTQAPMVPPSPTATPMVPPSRHNDAQPTSAAPLGDTGAPSPLLPAKASPR
jgi:hypothetical protein